VTETVLPLVFIVFEREVWSSDLTCCFMDGFSGGPSSKACEEAIPDGRELSNLGACGRLRAPTHPLLARLEMELQDIKTSVAAQLNKLVHFGGQVSWTYDFHLGGSASHNVVTSSAKANDLHALVILKPAGADLELDQYLCSLLNAGRKIRSMIQGWNCSCKTVRKLALQLTIIEFFI